MPFCSKCGAEHTDDAKTCPGCGAPIEKENSFEDTFNKINNTKDTTSEFDSADIEENKAMAILAYIGPLVFVPMFAAKGSKFAKYHTNQGLILFLIEIISSVVTGILGFIPPAPLFSFIVYPIHIAEVVFMVLGIVNAAQGRAKELPFIGSIRIFT